MVKPKISKLKILDDEEGFKPGKIYEMSGPDGEVSLCQVNPETGKLEEVKKSAKNQGHQKAETQKVVQDSENNGGDNRRWVNIEGVAKHGSFKVSAIRYWIRLTSVAKSNILSVGPNGGRILSELVKQGIIYNVSSTGIRVKTNLDEKEAIVKEIVKSDFDKIWAILQELRHVIPFHKQGKLIRFDLQEIDPWMKRKEVDN